MELQSIKQRFSIIGNSIQLNAALDIAVRVAPTNLSVLITGESGVGKEVFSHIIHQLSPRKHGGFIAINCGAIPEGTIDSELFGHEKGSFTGAQDKRKGYFETVSDGTIFLDEIGEMPLGTQARLLRVLESGEFIKVGSSIVQKTEVRVLAATNVNLPKLVREGKFREDLYYRLNTVPIFVPPLRERKEDIPILFRKFCLDFSEKYKMPSLQLTDEAKNLLSQYYFPGNIRELKNIAEQVSVLAYNKLVGVEELAKFIPNNNSNTSLQTTKNTSENNFLSDREILYKMMFDIKHDLNDLKRFVFAMSSGSQFDTSEIKFPAIDTDYNKNIDQLNTPIPTPLPNNNYVQEINTPVLISPEINTYEENSEEENLSIFDKEKELIIKALKKHRNKRKDAALDLGISERTLYRKLKEYNLEENVH